jgi:hypothetical protein
VSRDPHEDLINPGHYRRFGAFEPARVVEAWGLGWHLGSVVSYLARAGHKTPDRLADLKKALWFLKRHIKLLEKEARGAQDTGGLVPEAGREEG